MVYIGIDLGGTGIAVGIVTEEGKIIQKGSAPTLAMRPYQEIVKDMAAVSLEILKEAGLTIQDVRSVGIGVPGIANPNTGVVVFCTNLSWHDVPLREEFQKYIDKPVFIDNDATVAGYAESVAGISAGCHSSVFLTLGTGVGGGIVINGKPWSGFHNVGSEIGHITLELDGEPCSCGNKGCLERYCSATAIIRMARQALAVHPESLMMELCQNNMENVNAKLVFDAAREGDETALKIFRRYVKYMAQAINNIIAFLDPEVIVLGGGVSKAGDFLLDAVRAEVPQYLMFKTMPHPRVEIASLGADAGIIGAAMLGK
jgi:glucokinase